MPHQGITPTELLDRAEALKIMLEAEEANMMEELYPLAFCMDETSSSHH